MHHTLPLAAKNAAGLWERLFDCKNNGSSNPLCATTSPTALYLLRLDLSMWTVEAHERSDSRYTPAESRELLGQLAKLGEGRSREGTTTLVLPTWADYQRQRGFSANRVVDTLDSWPADRLPTEEPSMSLGIWGCVEYVWNRIPPEGCGGQPHRVKTALSFEVPFFAALARRVE